MYDPTKPMSPTNSPESMIGNVATTPSGAKVNTTTGALISAPPTTSTITSDLLAPTPAPVVSPTPVTSPISVATLPEATTSVTAPISDVEGLISQLEGRDVKAEVTAQTAEQQRGLNEINKQIKLHQARSLEAEKKALKMGETTGFARGEAERTRESNAVRALELSAQAQAAQGDLQLASTLATDSINEKYKKVEADLRKKRNDIIANYDNLSPADKKRADATLLRLNAEDAFVKEKKANETKLKDIGNIAAAKGAPLNLVQKAMATGDTIKANTMLAPYLNPKTAGGGSDTPIQQQQAKESEQVQRISDIDSLLSSAGLAGSVGAYGISRFTPFSVDKAERQDFSAGIHQLTGQLTLDNLIAAKSRGAAFGALSEGELRILANSATKISDWEIKDAKGNGTGRWEVSEELFKGELEKIKNLIKKDLESSVGYDPSVIGSDDLLEIESLFNEETSNTTPEGFDPSDYF